MAQSLRIITITHSGPTHEIPLRSNSEATRVAHQMLRLRNYHIERIEVTGSTVKFRVKRMEIQHEYSQVMEDVCLAALCRVFGTLAYLVAGGDADQTFRDIISSLNSWRPARYVVWMRDGRKEEKGHEAFMALVAQYHHAAASS